MPRQVIDDTELLEAALIGLEHKRNEIDRKMAEVRGRISGSKPPTAVTNRATSGRKRRRMSAAARRQIAAAQRKRWAEYKKAKGAPVKPVAKKRKLSAAGRRRII